MAADLAAACQKLLIDPGGTVESAVLLENRLDLSGDQAVLGRPLSRRLLPLPPGLETAASDAQLPAEPGNGVLTCELINQAKPLGGNCSFAKCAAASRKILLPPELSRLLAESVELLPFLGAEQGLISRACLTTIDTGLTQPAGEAAGREAEPLRNGVAGEDLLETELHGLSLLLRVNLRRVLMGLDIDGQTSEGDGVSLTVLSTEPGEPME